MSIYIAPYTKELSKELVSIDSFEEQLESIRPKELFSFNEKDNFIYAEDKDGNSIEDLVIYVTNKNDGYYPDITLIYKKVEMDLLQDKRDQAVKKFIDEVKTEYKVYINPDLQL